MEIYRRPLQTKKMIYYLIRPIVRVALKLFLREIHIEGLENIPKNKAVILAANHPTGFIEPCVMACFQERSLFFLARGNLFGKRLYDFFLEQVHILPVYRLQDRGYGYVKNNFSTFEACYESLGKREALMILAEGSSIHEKRLRPLVKGTGRIAFGTLDSNPHLEDVYIVPIGINYTHAERFLSDLYVDVGEPISTKAYMDNYKENRNKGILKLTQELRTRMLERIIHIENPDDDNGVEVLLEMVRPNTNIPGLTRVKYGNEQLKQEKKIVDAINVMPQEEKNALWNLTAAYQSALEACGVDDNVFKVHPVATLPVKILFFLLMPLFFVLSILVTPPFLLAKYIADTRVKYIEFYTSVLLAVALGAYLVYWLFLSVVFFIIGGGWIWGILLFPLVTVFWLYYLGYYIDYLKMRKWSTCEHKKREEIRKKREDVLAAAPFLNETDHFLNGSKKIG